MSDAILRIGPDRRGAARCAVVLAVAAALGIQATGCSDRESSRTLAPAATSERSAPPARRPLARGEHRISITSESVRIEANGARLGDVLDELAQRMGVRVEVGDSARDARLDADIDAPSLPLALPSLLRGHAYHAEFEPAATRVPSSRLTRLQVGAAREGGVSAASPAATAPDDEADEDLDFEDLPLDEVLERIEHGSREERLAAIRATPARGEGLQALIQVVESDGDPEARAAAADQLEDTLDFAGVSALIAALDDRDPRVVRAAVSSLEFAGDESVIPRIEPLLSHEDPGVRKAAADAIEFLRD